MSAASSPVPSASAGLVDVHAHFLPTTYLEAVERSGMGAPDGIAHWPSWDADDALALMDELGVAAAVLSVSSPGLLLGGGTDVAALARRVNDEGAALVRAHPDRFGFFASLPLPDVDAATREAVRALDELGADGVVCMTNYDDLYLGDRRLDPLFAALTVRQAVVFVHPTSPSCWDRTSLDRPRPLLEFFFDTTRAITNYLLNGGTERHPGVEMIVPHAGAALPVLADRIVAFVERGATAAEVTAPQVAAGLRRLWFDLAGLAAANQSHAIRRLAGLDRLLYGSDFPFTPRPAVLRCLDQLRRHSALSADEVDHVLRRNAATLFPRLGGDR